MTETEIGTETETGIETGTGTGTGTETGTERSGQCKPAMHVEGVSTSHFQMHLDPHVFRREEQCKACIVDYAQDVYDRLLALQPTL